MNTKRKGFLNAGAINSIVMAVVFTLIGIIAIVVAPFVTTDNLCEVYEHDTENYKTYYVNNEKEEGYDYFVELKNGKETSKIVYYKDVDDFANLIQSFLRNFGWGTIILQMATLVVSIFVIRDAARNNRIGFIVALLVLSLLGGNLLTFAFMIVGLCLKNKPQIEIEEITKA